MTDTIHSQSSRRDHERKLRRAQANVQSHVVDAARARVPDVKTPAQLPASGAREFLRAARAEFARKSNRHLNRATRRELAKEVRLA